MEKNLYDECVKKGIVTYRQLGVFLGGKKLKVLSAGGRSASSHNYKPKFTCSPTILWANDNIISVSAVLGAGNSFSFCAATLGNSSIYIYELALEEEAKTDLIAELEAITSKFNTEEKELKDKIQIMEENGLDIYNEKLIKMIKAMSGLEFKKDSEMNVFSLAKLLCEVD